MLRAPMAAIVYLAHNLVPREAGRVRISRGILYPANAMFRAEYVPINPASDIEK